jgi:hypothetical protein
MTWRISSAFSGLIDGDFRILFRYAYLDAAGPTGMEPGSDRAHDYVSSKRFMPSSLITTAGLVLAISPPRPGPT